MFMFHHFGWVSCISSMSIGLNFFIGTDNKLRPGKRAGSETVDRSQPLLLGLSKGNARIEISASFFWIHGQIAVKSVTRMRTIKFFFNTRARRSTLGSLSTRVFETRTATGSELFSLLSCLHTTAFALPSIFSSSEMRGIKIWETPLSRHAKCPLPVVVRVLKTCVLKLPILMSTWWKICAHTMYNTLKTHTKYVYSALGAEESYLTVFQLNSPYNRGANRSVVDSNHCTWSNCKHAIVLRVCWNPIRLNSRSRSWFESTTHRFALQLYGEFNWKYGLIGLLCSLYTVFAIGLH